MSRPRISRPPRPDPELVVNAIGQGSLATTFTSEDLIGAVRFLLRRNADQAFVITGFKRTEERRRREERQAKMSARK